MEIKGISDRMTVEGRRVEVHSGGGCLPIVGVPFLLIGCAPVVALVCSDLSRAGVFAFVFAAFWCLFFIPLGVWLTFSRSALEIDGNSRTYRRRSSVLVVTKETAGSLDKFDKVTVSRREQRRPSGEHGNRTYTDYPIGLDGMGETLDIAASENMDSARRDAEQVAKALRLPLADRTGPIEIVREADRLDESLRERRHRTGKGPGELPPPPEGMQTQFRIEGEEAVLDIPAAGFTPAALWLLSPAVVMPAFVIFIILEPRIRRVFEGPDMVLFAWAAGLFVFLVGFFIPIYIGVHLFLRAVVERYTVRVSRDRLRVTTRGLVLSRVAEIPAGELEELSITKPDENAPSWEKPQIVARSDRTTIQFGRHLPPEEKKWIKTMLHHVLTE